MKLTTILLFLAISTFALAQTAYRVNSNGGLNLRENPGTESKTIASLPDGTPVTILDKSNDKWWKVKADGKTGYVSSSFLKEDNHRSNKKTQNKPAQNTQKASTTDSNKTSGSYNNGNHPGTWAAGLRLGDPMGLTVKKYLNKNRAFDINIGRTSHWGHHYKNHFYKFDKYKGYDYQGFNGRGAFSFQFHYLYNKNIPNAQGLQWYLGFGPQIRVLSYTYNYRQKVGPGPNDWVYLHDRASNIDLGLDGVIGMEYKFNNTPLSVFGEVDLFMEVIDQPLLFRWQGGLGIRFHF